jgi:hypothetical protein
MKKRQRIKWKNIQKKVLKYHSARPEFPNPLSTLSVLLPEWYKKTPKWKDNIVTIFPTATKTFKQCSPFLDSLLTGYAVVLPVDVLISSASNEYITWRSDFAPLIHREQANNATLPVPAGHLSIEFAWKNPVAIKIPAGYSLLVTHPLNRYDLPFTTLSGVIDGEYVFPHLGNIPFFLKEGFEGVIPQGTPIAQILPFKRESWNLEIADGLLNESDLNINKSNSLISGWYKKTIWKKKSYT